MRKSDRNSRIVLAVIPAALILAAGVAFLYSRSTSTEEVCARNVARLAELEASDFTVVEQALDALREQEAAERKAQMEEGIASSEGLLTDIQIRQAFSGSVIVGDSITQALIGYGYLDTDVVISKLGLRIDDAQEQIQTAISLYPRNIFLAFGTNDMALYNGNTQAFIDAYREKVELIQTSLPDTPIYINSILPVLQSAIDTTPGLAYYPQFNEALESFCQEMGCTFIDNTFLVEGNPDMYEPDGEHVIMDYYPKWLTYMAETAGLV